MQKPLLVVTIAVCISSTGNAAEECATTNEDCDDAQAVWPLLQPGKDVCISVIDHCSAMMDSPNARQQCMKRELEGLLSSDERLQRVRAEMVLSPDLYLLCSFSFARAVDAVGGDGDTARVQTLNTLLQRASEAMSATGDDAVLNEYREAARWSELDGWSAAEKLTHFMAALMGLLPDPDNMHCIDRLAVTFGEYIDGASARLSMAARTPDAALPPRVAAEMKALTNRRQAAAQAQKLLLHYAIVRKIIQHPLQRPLAPVERGLSALPFWRTKTPETEEQLANEAVFPWVAALEDKAAVTLLQGELLGPLVSTNPAGNTRTSSTPAGTLQSEGIHSGEWMEAHLITQGAEQSTARKLYPKTFELLEATGIDFINARLSVLQDGTHISAHCGVSNAKLRAHLPLRVPASNENAADGGDDVRRRTSFRVGQHHVKWIEGQVIIFDDSFEHEVWWNYDMNNKMDPIGGEVDSDSNGNGSNNAKGVSAGRVVLILDFFHPQLSQAKQDAIRRSWLS